MLTDGLTTRESEGTAGNATEVLDVAQLLLAGVKRGMTSSDSTTAESTNPDGATTDAPKPN